MTKIVATSKKSFSTRIDLDSKDRARLVELLNQHLATNIDLQAQAKYAHWNVKGENFIALHELFDKIAQHAEDAIDLLAERVTALGGVANGTIRQAAAGSILSEYNINAVHGGEHVEALAESLSKTANAARQAIELSEDLGDKATADVFTELVRGLDKDLWFLEAHLH